MGTAELKPIHLLMHYKPTHSPSERLPPQETPATSTMAEEVRLVGAAWSRQEKVQESMPVSIHNEKETDFSEHNYNTCWSLRILTWVNALLQKQLRALPVIRPFSQQKMIASALLCHVLGASWWEKSLMQQPHWEKNQCGFTTQGQCLHARHLYHWLQTSPSSLIFPWKESLWDLPVHTLACPSKGRFLTSLAIFIYTQQMDLSHTLSSYMCVRESACR